MRLAVHAEMRAAIEIGAHAPLAHRAIRLRPPRAAGLAVAGRRLPEDALDVIEAGLLAALELGDAVVPGEIRQIQRRRWLGAVEVGVIADLVLLERRDDIGPLALLQHPRLLADHLEGRTHAAGRQDLGDFLRGIVAGGQEVVLRVEPEDDVHLRRGVG